MGLLGLRAGAPKTSARERGWFDSVSNVPNKEHDIIYARPKQAAAAQHLMVLWTCSQADTGA